MASFIWARDPQEAHANPYESEAQKQFAREANKFIDKALEQLSNKSLQFKTDETSLQKAIWLLQTDAIAFLKDALDVLQEKKHRVCSLIFRNVLETLDLAAYFSSGSEESISDLKSWYEGEIVLHGQFRKQLKKTKGNDSSEARKKYHRSFSKFTHRSYRAILDSYSVGRDSGLVFDGIAKSKLLVLPHTISTYYAVLGDLIIFSRDELGARGLMNPQEVANYFEESMEPKQVPRKFVQVSPNKSLQTTLSTHKPRGQRA